MASEEIKQLRHQNQLMAAKLEVYDGLMLLFRTEPNHQEHGMMHPDIMYELNKYIEYEKSKDASKEMEAPRIARAKDE